VSFFFDISTIIGKELKVASRDPLTLVLRSVVMPIIWIVFLGYGLGGTTRNLPIAVVLEDTSIAGQAFYTILNDENVFVISDTSYNNAVRMLEDKKVYAVVLIPPDFDDKREIKILRDNTVPMVSETIGALLNSKVELLSEKTYTKKATIDEQVLYGRNIEFIDFFAPALFIMIIVFSAIFSGGLSLMYDREFGTLKNLLVAPINKASIILGKTLAGVILVMVSVFSSFIIFLLLGVKIKLILFNILIAFAFLFMISVSFVGFCTAVASKVKRIEQLFFITLPVTLLFWFISGAIYPIEKLPSWVKPLSVFNPLTYGIDGLRSVLIRNIVPDVLLTDFFAVSLFSVAMFVLGMFVFSGTLQ